MIARIRGSIVGHDGSQVIIECGGLGYGVHVCFDDQQNLAVEKECVLFVAEQIKEDAHELFGFCEQSRKELFTLLISVNGVGPKAAMAILNIGTEAQVRSAIASGDTKFIATAQGVGKKVAERVVVDLKSKVGLEHSNQATEFLRESLVQDEAVEALISLGHTPSDAVILLKNIDTSLPTAERIRLALRSRIS